VAAETSSTRCETQDVTVLGTVIEQRLLACGDGASNNVLWHLDRADSHSGILDGSVTRPRTGRNSVVYVVDTGIQAAHDEFMRAEGSRVIAGLSLQGGAAYCEDGRDAALDPCFSTATQLYVRGHGTAVASVIAGRTTGVAPDAAIVSVFGLPAKDGDGSRWTEVLDLIVAHAWHPASPQFDTAVVSMSLAPGLASRTRPVYPDFERKMRAMIEGVDRDGNPDPAGKKFLFVVLAGNESSGVGGHCGADLETNVFPATLGASIDGLVTVGGITEDNKLWDRSCRGDAIDILAPATNMFVASPGGRDHYRSAQVVGDYPLNDGTSFSTPYVAGLAALLLEVNPKLTPAQLEAILKTHSSRIAEPADATSGRVGVFVAPHVRRRAVSR
jgi:subtilisin family serine protease